MLAWFKSKNVQSEGADSSELVRTKTGQSLDFQNPSNKDFCGLHKLYEPLEGKVAANIVLIHRLTGNCISTWTKNPGKKKECFWPQELLPKAFPNVRMCTWGYDADVMRKTPAAVVSTNTIEEHAEALCSDMAALNASSPEGCPTIFIVHSLGGLVCKTALLHAAAARTKDKAHIKSVADQTRGIIFLGTPHRGSSQASWGTMLARMFSIFKQTNVDIVSALEKEAKQLNLLQRRFANLLDIRKESGNDVEVTCFFEELPMPVIGTKQHIVPMDSATFGSHTALGIHANHSDMTKYSGDDSSGYIRVTAELNRWLSKLEAEKCVPSPIAGDLPTKFSAATNITTTGGVHHHGNNAKGANTFYGGTFGPGTQIGSIQNRNHSSRKGRNGSSDGEESTDS